MAEFEINSNDTFYGGFLGTQLPDRFTLSSELVKEYRNKQAPFGFNGLGEVVYLRTYAREIESGKQSGECEVWVDTVERVVTGVFEILQHYIVNKLHCSWDTQKAKELSEDMFKRMFDMKFLPPGRGLWAMGSPVITKKGFAAALNNCAFVSTNDLHQDRIYPFTFLMDASMLGVGVGFDTVGAGSFTISGPNLTCQVINHIITDDREGWVESVRLLLHAYFNYSNDITFDYSKIRELGTKLKTFGGTSSGPGPLITLHKNIRKLLDSELGKPISVTCITDIMNMIGVCTISGNIRRCLPKGSLIHSKNGLIPIEDIKIGDLVQTSSGYERVTDTMIQGVQQLVNITTQDGFFKCTPNHHMAVMKTPTTYEWIMAKDLKPEDILLTTRVPIDGIKSYLPLWNYNHPEHSTTCKDIVIPELDIDIAWLIGFFSGDGYTYPNYDKNGFNAHISIVFGLEEYDMAMKAKSQLQRFGNDLKITLKKRNNENSYIINCVSKQLAWYFDKNVKQANCEIIVPEYIKTSTIDVRLGYIAGVMDSDGSTKTKPIQIVSTVSKLWITQLQTLCYSCGFETRLNVLKKQVPSGEDWQLLHKLTVITRHSKNIVTNIPQLFKKFEVLDIARHSNRYPANIVKISDKRYNKSNEIVVDLYEQYYGKIQFCPVEIINIETIGSEETFDITVENKHEFYCNGYLTHNSAEISFGQADCKEFLNLKNYDVNPQRIEHGWASNNSIFANIGMDYTDVCEHVRLNGEPGFAWLSNMKSYSRMNGNPDNKDSRVSGGNPCLEQSLESMELCCLVETFPNKHDSLDDFQKTLKSAFLFAKTVTLLPLHWQKSNEIMMRNRRIGCSVSGIAQFITDHGLNVLKYWLETGYDTLKDIDREISEWLCIRQSIKMTSVKPSGTVSLLAGATPGIHYPESKYYIRRIRIARDSYLLTRLVKAGYHVEPCAMCPETTIVVEFPVCAGSNIRTVREVSMWEQLSLAAFMQRYWADNQVSATITFDPVTEGPQIANALNYFQYQLKGISFLPRLTDNTVYKQIPYEGITEDQYNTICSKINKNVSLSTGIEATATDETHMTYCDNSSCIRI